MLKIVAPSGSNAATILYTEVAHLQKSQFIAEGNDYPLEIIPER